MPTWKSHTLDVVLAQGNPSPFPSAISRPSPPPGLPLRIALTWCSVATGNKYQHKHEEEELLLEALGLAEWDPKDTPKGVQ